MIHRYIIEATDEGKGFDKAIERLDREWGIEELKPCEDAISRKEALECAQLVTDDDGIMHEVIHVDDINDLPTVKPKAEPCDDAISRQAVLALAEKGVLVSNGNYQAVCKAINELPSVKPEGETITEFADRCRECGAKYGKLLKSKKGQWIKYGIPRCGEQHYKCTSCGYYINFGQWGELYTKEFKFCPNCGCRMVEPQESESDD